MTSHAPRVHATLNRYIQRINNKEDLWYYHYEHHIALRLEFHYINNSVYVNEISTGDENPTAFINCVLKNLVENIITRWKRIESLMQTIVTVRDVGI